VKISTVTAIIRVDVTWIGGLDVPVIKYIICGQVQKIEGQVQKFEVQKSKNSWGMPENAVFILFLSLKLALGTYLDGMTEISDSGGALNLHIMCHAHLWGIYDGRKSCKTFY